jgi:hypothetical protein
MGEPVSFQSGPKQWAVVAGLAAICLFGLCAIYLLYRASPSQVAIPIAPGVGQTNTGVATSTQVSPATPPQSANKLGTVGPKVAAATMPVGFRTIHNDFFWRDQSGAQIYARSGCLRQFNGLFYWYGEWNGGVKGGNDHTCYCSNDLVHWTYRGIVLHSFVGDPMDVLYNDSTRQYVMFLKCQGTYGNLAVATSPTPDGQFTSIRQTLVGGMKIGDMSVFKDTDGKAYLAFAQNRDLYLYALSADYQSVGNLINRWLTSIERHAPFIFKRNDKYYYCVKNGRGWQAGPMDFFMATDLAGPWSAARPLVTTDSGDAWESEGDFVVPIQGTQGTVYMYDGDRWGGRPPGPRRGDFLWLPMEFNGDVPVLNYYQDWDLDVTTGTWRRFDTSRDLALGKPATASSDDGKNIASNVTASTSFENYDNCRWESESSDPQWIMVDLGAATEINRVILKWHTDCAKAYKIQASTDGRAWTDVYNNSKGLPYTVTDETFPTTTARYVRMYGSERATQAGYSLFSFMVLNDSAESGTPAAAPSPSGSMPAP